MAAVTRLADPYSCGDTQAVGSGNVFINGLPVSRVGDATAGHPCGPPTVSAGGSGTVSANGIPINKSGDPLVPHGTCSGPPHGGSFTAGSPDVFTP